MCPCRELYEQVQSFVTENGTETPDQWFSYMRRLHGNMTSWDQFMHYGTTFYVSDLSSHLAARNLPIFFLCVGGEGWRAPITFASMCLCFFYSYFSARMRYLGVGVPGGRRPVHGQEELKDAPLARDGKSLECVHI